MRVKLACLAGALTLGLSSFASAADLPARGPIYKAPAAVPVFSWTGCYIGGFAGGAFPHKDATSQDLNGYNYGGAAGPAWSYNVDASFIGGGTIGCNYQMSNWVIGLEGEGGYMKVEGSAFDPNSPFVPLDTEARTKIGDWYAVVAGRFGIAYGPALFYGKVGAAFANVEHGVNDANPAGGNTVLTRRSETQAALAAGAGIEYALGGNWSVKGEYLYLDFRASDTTCGNATVGGGNFCWSNDFRGVHTGKFGVNYRFSGP